jgi:predicted amidophosphoribosyltransferase
MTDFGFFEAKGVCPNCRAVIDDIYKILCDTCQKKKGEKND